MDCRLSSVGLGAGPFGPGCWFKRVSQFWREVRFRFSDLYRNEGPIIETVASGKGVDANGEGTGRPSAEQLKRIRNP